MLRLHGVFPHVQTVNTGATASHRYTDRGFELAHQAVHLLAESRVRLLHFENARIPTTRQAFGFDCPPDI